MAVITIQELQEAAIDAGTVENFSNGAPAMVTPRFGDRFPNMPKLVYDFTAAFNAAQAARVAGFNTFLINSGYETPVDYTNGISITRTTQQVRYLSELYRPKDTVIPFTTGASFDATKWISNGDNALRQELAALTGSHKSGHARSAPVKVDDVGKMLDTLSVSIWEYAHLVTSKPTPSDPKTWDWTPALQGAADALAGTSSTSSGGDTPTLTPGVIRLGKGEFFVGNYKIRSLVTIEGEDHASCWIKPLPGATGFMFDLQNATDRPRGVCFRNFSVSPSRNVSVTLGVARPVISAFNLEGFEKQCSMARVKVYNIDGTAIKTGDTQDMYIPDVEIRFVTKPLDINSKQINGTGTPNPTNAVVFQKLRVENSGQSEIKGHRSLHFNVCKFEEAALNITDPHGLDFIGCDWALATTFSVTVSGVNRGMRIIGGSTDTGLPINTGANTAKFITSATPVVVADMMFRGHGPLAITGEVTTVDCIYCECDRPFSSGGGSVYPRGNASVSTTNSTGTQPQFLRSGGSPYEVPTGTLAKAPAASTWYQNITDRTLEVFLLLPYDTTAGPSNFQIKKRHASGLEYVIANVKHPTGGGAGEDVVCLTLLVGEEYWYNRGSNTSAPSAMAFFR